MTDLVGGLFLFLALVMGVVGVVAVVFWILMIVDVASRPAEAFPEPGPSARPAWVLVVVLTGIVGALIYFFSVRRPLGHPGAPGGASWRTGRVLVIVAVAAAILLALSVLAVRGCGEYALERSIEWDVGTE